ncbi:MAG: sensory box histidine kinase/response regulator, partial [Conexibacter sp.]|nr:sensory box histidine kinase/response regulator [Conexibacter sp.]
MVDLRGVRLRPSRQLLRILGVAVLYALAVRVALAMPVRSGLIAVWPAAGVALGLMLRGGVSLWPGVFLGAFLSKVHGHDVLPALGGALAPTVEAVVCVLAIDRFIRPRPRSSIARVGAIGILAAGALLSATIGQTTLWLDGRIYGPWLDAVLRWALGDISGMLLIAPLILAIGAPLPRLRPLRVAEDLVAGAGVVVACYLIFDRAHGQIWLLIPIGVWLVLRGSPLSVGLSSIGLTIISVRMTAAGHGPFVIAGKPDVLEAQAFAAMVSACLYLLSALTNDRRRMLTEHQRLSEEAAALQRVATAVAGGATLREVAELAGHEV